MTDMMTSHLHHTKYATKHTWNRKRSQQYVNGQQLFPQFWSWVSGAYLAVDVETERYGHQSQHPQLGHAQLCNWETLEARYSRRFWRSRRWFEPKVDYRIFGKILKYYWKFCHSLWPRSIQTHLRKDALCMVPSLQCAALQPSRVTYCTAITTEGKETHWQESLQIFETWQWIDPHSCWITAVNAAQYTWHGTCKT